MSTDNSVREVDLIQLIQLFFKHKIAVVSACALGGLLMFAVSYLVPVTYKSSVTLMPVESQNELNPANLMGGNLGNLANLAGFNLGPQSSSLKINIEIIKSRQFVLEFVKSHGLTLDLIAANQWQRSSDSLGYDPELYDSESKKWIIENEFKEGEFREPSDIEIYEAFMKNYAVSLDSDSGLLNVSLTHVSPNKAKAWLNELVKFANKKIREQALLESEQKIAYLQEKMENTRIESIRSIFFQLIESELQTKMLVDTRQEYAYKIIDPPFTPEKKFAPKRAYYLVLGGLFTFIFIVVGALVSLMFSSYKKSQLQH